ncbi:MAG TPA: GreA/GreB family elongation factor [Flavobacteriaceae bacterium]|nr:GreA/GreB family elongation factor [Flavobacteriaceae bacterium]
MSRGFVKEDDQEEAPFIPPRAALPEGVVNYVTPFGHRALLEEKKALETERKNREGVHETERRRAAAVIDGKINLLNERIASARIVESKNQPQDEVRFGASVSLKNLENQTFLNFQIVGVDEADIKQGKIAFVAPIAMVITGKKVGETVDFILGNETRKLEVVSIAYKS